MSPETNTMMSEADHLLRAYAIGVPEMDRQHRTMLDVLLHLRQGCSYA
jgi:hypothetical protein